MYLPPCWKLFLKICFKILKILKICFKKLLDPLMLACLI